MGTARTEARGGQKAPWAQVRRGGAEGNLLGLGRAGPEAGLRGGAPRRPRMGRGLDGRRRSAGSQGNRVQQLEPRGCLEASCFPLADMCTAEVDRHVAQRYLLKRRLGKGVSSRGARASAGPAGRG